MKKQDTYREIITITFPNAVARVHIPDLTATERARRMQDVCRAAVGLMKEVYAK